MLKYHSYNIVFQEIPNEITLAINITNCPNCCRGCHSPWLQADSGMPLNNTVLDALLHEYGQSISCVCFMGGDTAPQAVEYLCKHVKSSGNKTIKTAWYSGRIHFPKCCSLKNFDYLKLGPYINNLGGLDSMDTNQRFYHIKEGVMIDKTHLFQKKKRAAQLQ